jgi:hypothetical protein
MRKVSVPVAMALSAVAGGVLSYVLVASEPHSAAAQTGPGGGGQGAPASGAPRLPGGGGARLPGGGGGRLGVPNFGSGSYVVSSSANEHGSFLWIVDSVQQAVMLCEKGEAGKDFTCLKKPLQ